MADTNRWRFGETNPLTAAVDPATVIEIGDLLYLDGDDVKPASDQADQGSEAANQALFATGFVGVAAQRSRSGEADDVRIDTDGVFEFACAADTWEVGDLVGVAEASSGMALENQTVVAVSRPELAIGHVVRREPSAVTRVRVRLQSRTAGPATGLFAEARNGSSVEALSGNVVLSAASARIQVLDPDGTGRDVTLPPESASRGLDFIIRNAADAAEVLTIKDDGGATICTPTQNETAWLFCDGAAWRGLVGAHN